MNQTIIIRTNAEAQKANSLIANNWASAAAEKRPLVVTIAPYKAKRTLDQNAKLHAICAELADNAWVNNRRFGPEVWKEHLKAELLGNEEVAMPDGGVHKRTLSTARLSVGEFADFLTKVGQYAFDKFGIEV